MPPRIGAAPAIEVLSNRPDLISGGDVLIEVVLPAGIPATAVILLDDGRIATSTRS